MTQQDLINGVKLSYLTSMLENPEILREELLDDYADEVYSHEQITGFIEDIDKTWRLQHLTPTNLGALLDLVSVFLISSNRKSAQKSQMTIPICYFSPMVPLSVNLLKLYLSSLGFKNRTYLLNINNERFENFIASHKPSCILVSLFHFHEIPLLEELVQSSFLQNIKVIVGGIPFEYDNKLKDIFPNCEFPMNLHCLAKLLRDLIPSG